MQMVTMTKSRGPQPDLIYFWLRKLVLGASTARKESATVLSDFSSFVNLTAVVDVTNKNKPFPTVDADMYAFLSLSLIAGVKVVKDAT